ncbi:RNA-binding KH domain-containing protein RCF3-like [Arachis hypogaea]|uniref:RNA-binding KH domain-containing protein RCF3-like n=1 Tax=Arachis hypogaea TaxID=3818 RepID=UPI003B215C8F
MTSSKRPNAEPNGKAKRQKSGTGFPPLDFAPGSVVFRLLCSASRIGSVIGKGGVTVTQIRQETGVKVKIEEAVPGCDERVITILGSDKETEEVTDQGREVNNNNNNNKNDDDEAESKEKEIGAKDDADNDEDKGSVPVEDLKSEKGHSAIRKALSLVLRRCQVGCLLGKGGSVIKQMSADSGAQIRILPRDKLPLCASDSDELVQITGGIDVVRKALQSVSQQLLENPPRDHEPLRANPTGPSSHSSGQFPPHNRSLAAQGAPFAAGPHDISVFHPGPPVIPKFHEGGAIIKAVQQETASEIKVIEGSPDSEHCIIVISGPAINNRSTQMIEYLPCKRLYFVCRAE